MINILILLAVMFFVGILVMSALSHMIFGPGIYREKHGIIVFVGAWVMLFACALIYWIQAGL